jgi:hypothetical protein
MLMPASLACAPTTADDAYIAGYAAGALKHNLNLEMPSLAVRDGVITVPTAGLDAISPWSTRTDVNGAACAC